MKKVIIMSIALTVGVSVMAQGKKDKAKFVEYTPGYYQKTILKGIKDYQATQTPDRSHQRFTVALDPSTLPTDPSKYTQQWHKDPISQGNTGTCWCFSTTSFYESEVYRQTKKEVKLSEIFTVYWEYVERAKYFVEHRGDMFFGEGSETNAVGLMMAKYGIVPRDTYTGLVDGRTIYNHQDMFDEMKNYLASVKENNLWNEEDVVATIKSILNHYMGVPPKQVTVEGKKYTPLEYLHNYLKLNPDDYITLMSLENKDFWTRTEYKVPDNWWHNSDYVNVPADNFIATVKEAIAGGYTISIGGDVSESGIDRENQVAVVPTYDIPSEYINDDARLLRFLNGSTTDDHAMHLIGYQVVDGKTWFLVKDSGSGTRNYGESAKQFGYYFFNEDYIKLKIMTITLHKDAVKGIMKKVKF